LASLRFRTEPTLAREPTDPGYRVVLLPSGFAGEVKVPSPIFNTATAREFPQAAFDRISAKITRQTTFQQLSPGGLIRWQTQAIQLAEFVKALSPTYPDTYLYAMRDVVSVVSERHILPPTAAKSRWCTNMPSTPNGQLPASRPGPTFRLCRHEQPPGGCLRHKQTSAIAVDRSVWRRSGHI
jgi:hypothetical protein